MNWRSLINSAPIGLDLSGRALCAVQLSAWRTDAPIAAALRLPRSEPTKRVDATEIRRASEVLRRQGFRGRSVVLAMPPDDLMTEVVEVRGRDETSIDAVVRNELARTHRAEPESFEVAHWALPERSGKRDGTVMAVACAHEAAGAYVDLFEAAGFDVRGLDVRPWALARACRSVKTEGCGGVFAIDAGWQGAQLAVLHADTVLYTRTLSDSALSAVHERLASALELDHEMTSYLLEEVGLNPDVDGEQVDPEILPAVQGHLAIYVDKLRSELRRSIDYMRHEYPDATLDRVLVVGEGAAIPGLTARLGEAVGMTADAVTPFELATCRDSVRGQCRSPVLTTALGLARYPKR